MKFRHSVTFILFLVSGLFAPKLSAQTINTDLLIIGGGASGTTAAIQASRMGVKTLIVEETEWLGGMLTSGGVSAIDGNHNMPSGIWGEFRQKLYDYYGGPKAVETGWVSNTLFEPSVGNKILKEMAQNDSLLILYKTVWKEVKKKDGLWKVTVITGGKKRVINAKLLIDATELGDVMAIAGVLYSIGMDSRNDTGEEFAPEKANNIIQDLTYVITLTDFGKGSEKTIPKPEGYNSAEFKCSCDIADPAGNGSPDNNCYKMLQYARLPGNKYMINWPKCGNDFYLNIIENTPIERTAALKEAKLHTLRFLYYLQTELGFKNLGIADGEYPTSDNLPMYPYYRESRRVKGLVNLTLNHVAKPYEQKEAFYRTGIAVGDYPIDHHHLKNATAPAIDFVKIKVPSYNIPLGSLIPAGISDLIVAEKSISVSNIVNGTTRLQPVVLSIGQAAGALAAVAIKNNIQPSEVNIREVQQALLDAHGYLMPFIDIKPDDKDFQPIQRIGATGILKGTGIPFKWANQTWFYPDRVISEYELLTEFKSYYPQLNTIPASGSPLTLQFLSEILSAINSNISFSSIAANWAKLNQNGVANPDLVLNRRQVAVLIDHYLKPFNSQIDFKGALKENRVVDSSYANGYYLKQRAALKNLPVRKNQIVFLGNSITEQGQWQKLLPQKQVLNMGISGDVSFGILSRLDEVLAFKPSKIFLMMGINDLKRGIPAELITANYIKFIRRIKSASPGTKVFIQSVLPLNISILPASYYKLSNEKVNALNEQLKALCKQYKLTYVNLHEVFADGNDELKKELSIDGLHLKPAAYVLWVDYLKKINAL